MKKINWPELILIIINLENSAIRAFVKIFVYFGKRSTWGSTILGENVTSLAANS